MLPVRHVARATILRSLSSRRLINNFAVHHRLAFPSARPHKSLQSRHYARFTEDVALEAALEAEQPTNAGAKSKGPFFCPFSDCPRSQRAFSRKDNLARHVKLVHKDESPTAIARAESPKEEAPRPISSFGSLLASLEENEETQKRRTRRKKVVHADLKSERRPHAEKDVAPELAAEIETLAVETPPTASTFEHLSALGHEEPPKPRGRRGRVTGVETHPDAEPPSQLQAPPEAERATETDIIPVVEQSLPPTTVKRKAGRQPGSKNKTGAEAVPEKDVIPEAEQSLPPTTVKRKAGRPPGSKNKTGAEAVPEKDVIPEAEQSLPPTTVKRKAGRPPGSKNKPPANQPPKRAEPGPGPKPRMRPGPKPRPKPTQPIPEPGYTADCVNSRYLHEALMDTGVWRKRKDLTQSAARARQLEMSKHADGWRINIVSEELCDDVLDYMKPGLLERHRGCDILDINPGAGLWSRKLNDMLQPRRHVLVEEDFGFYEPFLKPLVERQGTKVLQVPWIVWKDLFAALDEGGVLPEQKVTRCEVDEMPKRNDTLLVTMNLLTRSRKKLGTSTMGSMTGLVLYQLMASVRTQGLFQRYGLVRMLVWVDDHEKFAYLPKTVQRRRVGAIQAELSTEWVTEVAGIDRADDGKQYAYRRDQHIDMESMGSTLKRMKEAGYEMPKGRETELMQTYLELEKEGNLTAAGEQSPMILKKYEEATEALEALKIKKMKEGTWTRLDNLALHRNRWLNNQIKKRQGEIGDLLAKLDRLTELKVQIQQAEEKNEPAVQSREQFTELEAELEKAWEGFDQLRRNRFLVARDNLRAFKQPPELGPVLMWDRRYVEPLAIQPREFYPPVQGALLDIQPRAMESTLRATCSHGSKVYDQLDLILRHLQLSGSAPLGPAVDGLYHGAREGVADLTKSLHDVALGGSPLKGPMGELDMRALSRTQIVEFIEKWQQWPFKPTFPELVGRLAENDEESDPEGTGGSMMLGNIAD